MRSTSIYLDQNKNYKADFDQVFRSSGIFFIPKGIKTTISLSNYWEFKNAKKVSIVVSERHLDGRLAARREMRFTAPVLNLSDFCISEGSVEIEAFGSDNLRIPYAAIMAIYEADSSVSMVHTYRRNHSLIELENNTAITAVRETGWTIRAAIDSCESFAVFHNGHTEYSAQTGSLILINSNNEEKRVEFEINALRPFATKIFSVSEICPDYRQFFGNQDGWAALHFDNDSAFSRLLLCTTDNKRKEFQVTHSNFDYSVIQTNFIGDGCVGNFKIPSLLHDVQNAQIQLYPRRQPGLYTCIDSNNHNAETFESGLVKDISETTSVTLERNDGPLPARIVFGVSGKKPDQHIPFEASVGIFHEKVPPKRFHWATVSDRLNSRIFITAYNEFHTTAGEITLCFRLLSPSSDNHLEKIVTCRDLDEVPDEYQLRELFPEAADFLGDEFGYVSLFSNFHGFMVYTSIETPSSLSLEHSF